MKQKSTTSSDKKPNIFTTIQALSATRPLKYQDLVEMNAPYEPFMVNRAMSLNADTVISASIMNQRPDLDKDMQATFYIRALRPRRRFEKWPKLLDNEATKVVAKFYGMSLREAKLSVRLHTEEQLSAMRKVLEDGAQPSRFR